MAQKAKSRRVKFPEEASVIVALLVLVGIVAKLWNLAYTGIT